MLLRLPVNTPQHHTKDAVFRELILIVTAESTSQSHIAMLPWHFSGMSAKRSRPIGSVCNLWDEVPTEMPLEPSFDSQQATRQQCCCRQTEGAICLHTQHKRQSHLGVQKISPQMTLLRWFGLQGFIPAIRLREGALFSVWNHLH